MTHVRPPRRYAQDRQLFTTAQQWVQIGILGRFVISAGDLLFLPRFAQICYSCQNLLFPQSARVKWRNTKVTGLPRSKAAEPSSQFNSLKLFNIFPLISNSIFEREQQPSKSGSLTPSDDTVWSLHRQPVSDKRSSFPNRCETPGTPWCHPSLQSPFLQTQFLQSSPASQVLPLLCCNSATGMVYDH